MSTLRLVKKSMFRDKRLTVVAFFLFFCLHGFGYGTMLIKQAEGRRDPLSALYTHMPVAPAFLIYDFGCALFEYCMNYEPYFFMSTM
jgi:p-aminobenzoyl-glutamate transporter AbgT